MLRGGLMCFAMPEVVDSGEFPDANLTMHLPYVASSPGKLMFRLRLEDGAGKTLWSGSIDTDTAIEDLLRFRCVAKLPCANLRDGSYTVVAETLIDGAPPRPGDVTLRVPLHVSRGFKQRAERLFDAAGMLAKELTPSSTALLAGVVAQVDRVYRGEPRSGGVDALRDLQVAEIVLSNLRQKEQPLASLSGRVDMVSLSISLAYHIAL